MDILSDNKKMAGGGSGVIIHVVDTGVNPIPELAGVLTVVKFLGSADSGGTSNSGGLSDGVRDPFATYDYSDKENHGTAMAVCAHRQAPEARIYAYCAMTHVVEALNYIFEHLDKTKKHIVSMSFRGQGNLTDAYPAAMHNAIKRLVDAGVACVCASGNDAEGTLDKYPACFEEPFTVAAVDNDGKHAGFSNWPNETDFCELGVSVPCRDMNGRSDSASGTSPATAVVAGKLAAMWSKAPTLTEPELYEAAKANAQDLGTPGHDPYFGWGWIADVTVGATPPYVPDKEEEKEEKPVVIDRLLYLTTPRISGADVYALEVTLEALGYNCKMTSKEHSEKVGIFGPACDAALRAFQRDFAVDVYGKTCPDTLAALVTAQPAQTSPASRFIKWLHDREGDIYVWGAQGETAITEAWIRKRETSTANANRAIALWKKRVAEGRNPIAAFDCSGLIVAWLMAEGLIPGDLSFRGLYRACTPITRAQLQPGNLVFRHDALGVIYHVGVYIGDGEVIEAMGRDDGVVRRGINASGSGYWTDYGVLGVLT